MDRQKVVAIFDVGKTNKKLFLFNEEYEIVLDQNCQIPEKMDEEGDSCEDLEELSDWVSNSLREIMASKEFEIKAVNFSSYGASFVFLNKMGRTFAPLYNYLKPYPENLKRQFYETYGGEQEFSRITASPVLGSLNSGMQLYRIKYQNPEMFEDIRFALHLPQYLSYLITSVASSDITSIGCHTNLWNFEKHQYHEWVKKEGILEKLAPILPCNKVLDASIDGKRFKAGIGIHDSSAALIPYLKDAAEPFVLISTGTWCISMNPYNNAPLTKEELESDCLTYMTYQGRPVKSSRLLAGLHHDEQVSRIGFHFNRDASSWMKMRKDPAIIQRLQMKESFPKAPDQRKGVQDLGDFGKRNLNEFETFEEAYHQLMMDIAYRQFLSTSMVMGVSPPIHKIFVDGGFSKNPLFMDLLATLFTGMEISAASIAQASALGAAIAIHESWNTKSLPADLVKKQVYGLLP